MPQDQRLATLLSSSCSVVTIVTNLRRVHLPDTAGLTRGGGSVGQRLFLLDHCCVHKCFGHHSPSLHLFKEYFIDHFDDIITMVTQTYDDRTEGFEPDLICPYPKIAFFPQIR